MPAVLSLDNRLGRGGNAAAASFPAPRRPVAAFPEKPSPSE